MTREDEIRALTEELDGLRSEAENDPDGVPAANGARQREIIDRLATLGVQLG